MRWALLFSCVLGVCIAMLGFVRVFCRILPLPIIKSLARDTFVRLVGFLTIVHLHVGIPLLWRLIERLTGSTQPLLSGSTSFGAASGKALPAERSPRSCRQGSGIACLFGLLNSGRHLCYRHQRSSDLVEQLVRIFFFRQRLRQ